MDHYYDTVYQIQDGQFVKVAEGKTDGTITDGTISYTYTWNGETVDEAAYKSSLDGVIDLDQLICPYSSTVEWDEDHRSDPGKIEKRRKEGKYRRKPAFSLFSP